MLGYIIPTTSSLKPNNSYSRRVDEYDNNKSMMSSNRSMKLQIAMDNRLYFQQKFNHYPGDIKKFCSWVCVKRWVYSNHPIQFRYITEQLIDIEAGYHVEI